MYRAPQPEGALTTVQVGEVVSGMLTKSNSESLPGPPCRTQPAQPYVAVTFMCIFPAFSQRLCKDMVLSHKQRNRDSKSVNVWAKFKSVSDT